MQKKDIIKYLFNYQIKNESLFFDYGDCNFFDNIINEFENQLCNNNQSTNIELDNFELYYENKFIIFCQYSFNYNDEYKKDNSDDFEDLNEEHGESGKAWIFSTEGFFNKIEYELNAKNTW